MFYLVDVYVLFNYIFIHIPKQSCQAYLSLESIDDMLKGYLRIVLPQTLIICHLKFFDLVTNNLLHNLQYNQMYYLYFYLLSCIFYAVCNLEFVFVFFPKCT